jgi:uroporphyrinogen-III synthase
LADNEGVPTRIRETEQRLERAEQQLRLFQQVSRFAARDVGLPETLKGIVDLVVAFMQCDSCLLYLVDGDRLVLCASNGEKSGAVGKVSLKLNEGLTGWVARERRLLAISREAYNDPRFKYFSDLPEDAYEAFLSAPILLRGKVVGVINVQHRAGHAHSGSELEMITTVGEQVGCLLAVARLAAIGVDLASPADLLLASR